jgi:hypothetical protein
VNSVPGAGIRPSAQVTSLTMVFIICGGTSIDIVARSAWSRSRSA